MIGLTAIFWMFVIIFGIIGMMRGWARELMVTFSVILALFIISVLERFAPFIPATLTAGGSPRPLFWLRTIIIIALVFFGYQTPNIPKFASSGKFVRERLQDSLLGAFLGAINGYLIVGTIWWFLDQAGYPFTIVTPPPANSTALQLLKMMPPEWMGTPVIYFAVALAFVFVLVVFI